MPEPVSSSSAGSSGVPAVVTVTVQAAFIPEPSFAAAVMMASPAATAVTSPELLTAATASLPENQVSEGSVAFSGRTVAVRVLLLPFSRERMLSFKVIPVTGTLVVSSSLPITVTVQVAVFPPQEAVMVASLPAAVPEIA